MLIATSPWPQGLPLRLRHFPLRADDVRKNPVVRALRELRQSVQQGPTLLHCTNGSDRTGLVTALYGMVYEGWSKQTAIAEIRQRIYDFHSIYKNIPAFIQAVNVEQLRQ